MELHLHCKFCPLKFRLPKQLVKHIKKEHSQNLQPSGKPRQIYERKGTTAENSRCKTTCSAVVHSSTQSFSDNVRLCDLKDINNSQTVIPRSLQVYVQVNNSTINQQMARTTSTNQGMGCKVSQYMCLGTDGTKPVETFKSYVITDRANAGEKQETPCHNNDTILKYLTQSSPYKLGNAPKTTPWKTSEITTPPCSPLNVCVQQVQLQSSGPLLGSRITPSPVAGLERRSSVEKSDEGISGSLRSSGLTATPYRVHKSANNHMLPLENGFSLSNSSSKTYSFALLPDPQLPENFMEDSMDNSNDCSSSVHATNTSLSSDKAQSVDTDSVTNQEEKCANVSMDCDVITIDSDSNISARVVSDYDSDIEIVEEFESAKEQISESCRLGNTWLKGTERRSDISQNCKSDGKESIMKRKHSDISKHNEISIVMYQAGSPAKVPKLDKSKAETRNNSQTNPTKENSYIDITHSFVSKNKKDDGAHKNNVKRLPQKVTMSKTSAAIVQEEPSVDPTSSEAELDKDQDSAACLNEPPLITLFPNVDSALVTSTGSSISVDSRTQSFQSNTGVDGMSLKHSQEEGSRISSTEVSTDKHFTSNELSIQNEDTVTSSDSNGIQVQVIDSKMTSFSSQISNLNSNVVESKYEGLLGFPRLASKVKPCVTTGVPIGKRVNLRETHLEPKSNADLISHLSSNSLSNTVPKCRSFSGSNTVHLNQIGQVVTSKNIEHTCSSVNAALSKTNEHFAVVHNTTLHNKCLEDEKNNAIQHGTHPNNILVKEVTLNKNGPSLFGRIVEKKNGNSDINAGDKHNKVLVIETGLDSSACISSTVKKNVRMDTSCDFQGQGQTCEKSGASEVKQDGDGNHVKSVTSNEKPPERSKQNERVDDIRNQYRTKESRRKLWGLVQPPCANELLRAKRENLTLDDIYEEKITKLLERIGLNTFQGIPISQFFCSDEKEAKKNNNNCKTTSKKEASAPNREELMAKIAQRARYQEQVKIKVQALMEYLERRKTLRRNYTSLESLSKDWQELPENVKGQSHGFTETQSASTTNRVEPEINNSHIYNSSHLQEKGHTEVHKIVVSNSTGNSKVIITQSFPVAGKTYLQTIPVNRVPLTSNISNTKMFVKSSQPVTTVGYSVKVKNEAAPPVFDGVFKIPTKCAPSAYSSGRAVKVVLKSKPAVVANKIIHPQEVQVRRPTREHVTISNTFYRPVVPSVTNVSNDDKTKVFDSVSNPLLMQPLSVVTSDTQQTNGLPFTTYNKSVQEWTSPGKLQQFTLSSISSLGNNILLSPQQSLSQKDHSVLTQIHHSPRSSVKVKSNVKVNANFEVDLKEDSGVMPNVSHVLSDQTITRPPNQIHKNPAISPTGSSQNSLPDMDFMLMSNTSPSKQQILSPLKLISGVSELNNCQVSPVKDTSPSKDSSLLTLHDINPSELQALMSSPIKSFDLENSNLSTASQTELLETLQNFLRDIPSSVSPQPQGGSSSPQRLLGKGDPQSSFDQTNSAIILSTLFDTSPNKDMLDMGGKGKFFKHAEPSVSISQPSQYAAENMYSSLSPRENCGKGKTIEVNTECRCSSVSSDSQLSPTASLDLSGINTDEEFSEKIGQKEEADCPYVRKKLVVNAPVLYDENTMDRIVSLRK